ncbi:MAG: HNH endonuclease [Patescibacteria group bacterium]|nr:HNH endonuclease [Patescibacteria group bacterium]
MDHGADAAAAHGLKRSDLWPEVERAFRAKHPLCAACASTAVQIHHIIPFHFCVLLGRPDLELDPRNLIALCEKEEGKAAEDHHLLLGHLDDFESYDASVRALATLAPFHGATAEAIRASAAWKVLVENRPAPWASMTDADKSALRSLMDTWYPLATQKGDSMATKRAPRPVSPKPVNAEPTPIAAPAPAVPHQCNSGHRCACPYPGRHGCAAHTLKDGQHAA